MANTEASTGNIFNMGNLISFYNKERDKFISFGAYNGGCEITLSDGFKKGVAPKKVKLNYAHLNLLEKTIIRLMENPGPNQKAPIKFTRMERNSDGSWGKPVVYFILQFSTDDKSVFHIAAQHVDKDDSRIECISPIRTTGVESDLIMDQAASSMNALEGLLKFIQRVWQLDTSFTRNNLFIPNQNKKSNNSNNDLDFSGPSESDSVF